RARGDDAEQSPPVVDLSRPFPPPKCRYQCERSADRLKLEDLRDPWSNGRPRQGGRELLLLVLGRVWREGQVRRSVTWRALHDRRKRFEELCRRDDEIEHHGGTEPETQAQDVNRPGETAKHGFVLQSILGAV